MVRGLESKACSLCASAKRKCDRRAPECSRCKRGHKKCYYPPSRPRAFTWVELYDGESHTPSATTSPASTETDRDPAHALSPPITPSAGDPEFPLLPDELLASLQPRLWFTLPETWEVYRYEPAEDNDFPDDDLKRYFSYIRGWLSDWTRTGSNSFIHPRLYRARFPRPAQRAFTTLSSYLNRTPATEGSILRILDDDAAELVRGDKGAREGAGEESDAARGGGGDDDGVMALDDALEHLARVQALLVYTFIGLMDGDIRARHSAERRTATLQRWTRRLVARARATLCLGSLLAWPDPERALAGSALTDVSNLDDLLWYSWILAECVRRTYIVVSGVCALYELSKTGSTNCMGSMMYTTRKGVFEARSAVSWERLCSRVNVGMVSMRQGEQLMQDNAPDELDDFANVVLEITFGTERIERWKADKER